MKRKRLLGGLCCVAVMLILNMSVMAGEVEIYPSEPIEIVEDQYAESESFVNIARSLLQRGKCSISVNGSLSVSMHATTFANQVCSLIRTEMYLYKYNENTGTATRVSGPYRFATANASYGHASKIVSVPSTGYYLNYTVHTIGNESTTSQTGAVHVTY